MDPIFYTVAAIQGDYADLVSDQGQPHSITMFLLPEGTTVGSRLKLENFLWSLESLTTNKKSPACRLGIFAKFLTCCCDARCPFFRRRQ